MSVEEILRFSGDVTLDLNNLGFKEITTQFGSVIGQFRKGTDLIEGIAR